MEETLVNLVLTVTHTRTQKTADTKSITVAVPQDSGMQNEEIVNNKISLVSEDIYVVKSGTENTDEGRISALKSELEEAIYDHKTIVKVEKDETSPDDFKFNVTLTRGDAIARKDSLTVLIAQEAPKYRRGANLPMPEGGVQLIAPTSLAQDDGKIIGDYPIECREYNTNNPFVPATGLTGNQAYDIRYAARPGYAASDISSNNSSLRVPLYIEFRLQAGAPTSATNGTLTLRSGGPFSGREMAEPLEENFTATLNINGESKNLELTDFSHSIVSNYTVVKFNFTPLESALERQSGTINVKYEPKGAGEVITQVNNIPITIPGTNEQ